MSSLFTLPLWILFIISALVAFGGSFVRSVYTRSFNKGQTQYWAYTIIQNLFIAGSIFAVYAGTEIRISTHSIIVGALMGLFTNLGYFAQVKAFSLGSHSYTTVIILLSAVIPTLSGPFFGEVITVMQFAGIALMIGCFILSAEAKKDGEKKGGLKWFMFALGGCISVGLVCICQKVHQESAYAEETAGMLLSCFVTMIIIAVIMFAFNAVKEKTPIKEAVSVKPLLLLAPIGGILAALENAVNLYLVGAAPAAVVFPIVSLAPMFLFTVVSVLFFRERLTAKQWIGAALGVLAATCVSLF